MTQLVLQTRTPFGLDPQTATSLKWRLSEISQFIDWTIPLRESIRIPFFPGQLQDQMSLEVYGHPRGGKAVARDPSPRSLGRGGTDSFSSKAKAGNEVNVAPGISGSLVVNGRNQAVGLSPRVYVKNGIVAVVPVWSLADFVKSVLPSKYTETLSGEEIGKLYRPGNTTHPSFQSTSIQNPRHWRRKLAPRRVLAHDQCCPKTVFGMGSIGPLTASWATLPIPTTIHGFLSPKAFGRYARTPR